MVLTRSPAHVSLHHPNFGVQVGVFLAECNPSAHVQEVTDGSTVITRLDDLGDVTAGLDVQVEQALFDQDSGDAADNRLRDRHQQMGSLRGHSVEVLLEHDLTVVQHHSRVRPGLRNHLGEGRRLAGEPMHGDVV